MRASGRLAVYVGVALGLAVTTGGCASIRNHRGYVADPALIDSVQPGVDNRLSVERTLGRPTFVSQFGNKDWYYVSITTKQPAFRKTRTEKETVLRVRFDDAENVIAVDRAGMEKVANIDPDGDETPTLGRDRSFLQDLFGNVGAVGAPGAAPAAGGPGPNGS